MTKVIDKTITLKKKLVIKKFENESPPSLLSSRHANCTDSLSLSLSIYLSLSIIILDKYSKWHLVSYKVDLYQFLLIGQH